MVRYNINKIEMLLNDCRPEILPLPGMTRVAIHETY